MTTAVFVLGTFAAAFVASLAGFAFALVALAIWLYALTPIEATPLVAAYAVLVQGYAVWKLRHKLDARRLAPFLLGTSLGVPFGLAALWIFPSTYLRMAVGGLLVLFSLYSLMRPRLPHVASGGLAADTGVGLLNGLIGGSTGLAGIAVVIWSGLRGWPRDEQRVIFQPTAIATFLIMIVAFAATGTITTDSLRLFLIGLPFLAAGAWLGWQLYGRLNEDSFRTIVLLLLFISGIALLTISR